MPYNSVSSARDDIPSLEDLSNSEVRQFIRIFNSLIDNGEDEGAAIPIAISRVNEMNKQEDILSVEKADVERDSAGNLVYRGKKFAGYNKPRASDRDGKDGMVLAKEGDTVKLVHFGDSNLPHNTSAEANDRYYSRFGEKPSTKLSAEYWSSTYLWPRGDKKGKGGLPWVPLKKEYEMEDKSKFMMFMYNMYQMFPSMFNKQEDDELYTETVHGADNYKEEDPLYKSDKETHISIVKQFEEEEMIALEPLYINVGDSDAHSDGISDEQLDLMIENFNKNIENIKGNIHHSFMTEGFRPLKAYRMPVTVYVGDPSKPNEMVKIEEGMPVVKIQYAKNDLGKKYWKMRKEGKLGSPSIGAKGRRVLNPDYTGDKND